MFYSQFSNPSHIIYYESNNLLVRINGTNDKLPALLLSAHYDSVPTSFGITDDGMGIASMLGVLDYYSLSGTSQPQRTIIFNFNNDEEFGLNGADSFISHPWFKQIKYFLNLEGTGAGGKAVLFRGTDFGIVKYFKGVRYPFGTSIFQQGFNDGVVHSETDYVVYRDRGFLRGLDVAFYKPRDIYHTGSDNIKNVNIKSLWHMLSISLDFTEKLAFNRIDLDDEYEQEEANSNYDLASFASIFNKFFVFPISKILLVNIAILVIIPLITIPLLVVVIGYKKTWKWSFINVVKFPLSLVLSAFVLNVITDSFIISTNEFIVNSSAFAVIITLFTTFILLNYLILNGINFVFSFGKIVNHDEKLLAILEISFISWVGLLWSTIKLSHNKLGDDHTGELALPLLFVLQAVSAILGLIGWSFSGKKEKFANEPAEEREELLAEGDNVDYGTETEPVHDDASSSSLELDEEDEAKTGKFSNYDWSIQFLLIVPISSLIIYRSGSLISEALNKTVQESLASEALLYTFLQAFAIVWAIPFLPFVYKFNRIIVAFFVLFSVAGFVHVNKSEAFDQLNPLKLRFVQTIDLDTSSLESYIRVYARDATPALDVLKDLPSVKESKAKFEITSLADGLQEISFKSILSPNLVGDAKSFNDYININVLKNSSSNSGDPFGLLSGEIRLSAPKNRLCNLRFNTSDSATELLQKAKDTPVKTIIIYADKKVNLTSFQTSATPEGFSKDHAGNYIYKFLDGIEDIQLKKLSWDSDYHIGFQWVPSLVDIDSVDIEKVIIHKLGIQVDCYWADLTPVSGKNHEIKSAVPAYEELLHFSPNYVTWANRQSGLVSVSKYIEI